MKSKRLFEVNKNTYRCCICGTRFTGWGNNAEPVKEGTCCDYCNTTYVMPARIRTMDETSILKTATV